MKNVNKVNKLENTQRLAGKIHRYLFYTLSLPFILLIIAILFDWVVLGEYAFWFMIIVFVIYFTAIQYFNMRIKKLLDKSK
jgi:hypothetical protein